jgi:hypothetical protein
MTDIEKVKAVLLARLRADHKALLTQVAMGTLRGDRSESADRGRAEGIRMAMERVAALDILMEEE